MRVKTILATLALAALLGGCLTTPPPKARPEAVPYGDTALHNFYLGRHYQSRGRMELARDRFMQALATARTPEMRRAASREIEATDRLLQSQR